jgi:ribosomal protein L7/L12
MEIEIGKNPVVLNFDNGETVQVQRQFWNKNKLDKYDSVRASKHGDLIVFYGDYLSEDAKKGLETKEVQTEFNVELISFGDKKVHIVKAVKDLLNLGLRESMTLVGQAPVVISEGVTEYFANELKNEIEAIGGVVMIK